MRRAWLALALLASSAMAASNQYIDPAQQKRYQFCKNYVAFITQLYGDIQQQQEVNAMLPADQGLIDYLKRYKGTLQELQDDALNRCMGTPI